jgi:hypothetical protein
MLLLVISILQKKFFIPERKIDNVDANNLK